MHRKYLFVTATIIMVGQSLYAQTLNGRVSDAQTGEALAGATVRHTGGAGTATDATGGFRLTVPDKADGYIIASYLGYTTDTIAVGGIFGTVDIALLPTATFAGSVVVIEYIPGTYFSDNTLQKTETISQIGLSKMACCNLSESFENSAAVTVGYTDAVSGAKQVQLLGLSSVYSQMMAENVPTMRGLASTYGWSYTPGPWLESIQISKGASSVINGYESISGQINLEFRKPDNTESLFLNLYMDEALRMEANITAAIPVSKNLWAGLLLHGSLEEKDHDRNRDGFLDTPHTKLLNVYNRWFYLNPEKNIESRTGIKFVHEDRNAGQAHPMADGRHYRTDIGNRNFTVYNKTGIGFRQKEGQSLGIITSFTYHTQDSAFGMKSYDGTQNSFYLNTLFSSWILKPSHSYTAGASFSYDYYKTGYQDTNPISETPFTRMDRKEIVPGIYAQYTFTHGDNFTALAGARGDWNNAYGWLLTPRANVRYSPWSFVTLRASAGRGFRSANVLAENIGLMASSRTIDAGSVNSLGMEEAWNFGGNISFNIPLWKRRTAILSIDYFRTSFQNQVMVDTERDLGRIYFYDLKDRSFADAWQADLTFTAFRGFEIYSAFRYNNTKITLHDGSNRYLVEKPLVSRYRGLINLSFATKLRKWVFDYTAQVNGPSRLPDGYTTSNHSPVFWIHFVQATKNTKRFDVYLGVENILDYRQKNPIVNWEDPFGAGFDSSRIWGPLMGRRVYGGIRLRVGKL